MIKKTREKKVYRFEYSLLLYTIEIAVFAALSSIVFNLLVYYSYSVVSYINSVYSSFYLVVLFAALLIFYFAYKKLHLSGSYGVRAVKYELSYIDKRMMKTRNAISKIILTAVSIVGGFSVGTFGPTVHIGGFIGSNVAYRRKLNEHQIRVLIGTGVAAALSAVLRTPLFAAVVVLELFFMERRFEYLFPVLTASFVAVNIDKFVLGTHHLDFFGGVFSNVSSIVFPKSHFDLTALVLVISILSGALAISYIKTLHFLEKYYYKKGSSFHYVCIAVTATFVFALFSRHFLYLDLSVLTVDFVSENSFMYLLAFVLIKLLLTSLQLGFGVHGGNFKPGLYLGLVLGALIYKGLVLLGFTGFSLEFVMLISMTAMLSGFARAPLSAVILAVEMSSGVSLMIPLIGAALLSYFMNLFLIDRDINSEIS